MAERIDLVQGDNLPRCTITLKNRDGSAPDLTGLTDARLLFRKKGGTTVTTIDCDIAAATVSWEWPNGALAEPGEYEGEVELDFGGKKQTLFETLRFRVRAQFGA